MSADIPVGWLRRAFAAAAFGFLVAACSTASPSPAKPQALPWMLRHTFPDWDGQLVEVCGAPGPRAVAAFLALSMRRAGVTRPDELGVVLRQLPGFYEFVLDEGVWRVLAPLGWAGRVELECEGDELFRQLGREELFDSFTITDLAMAMNDVVWKWPRRSNRATFIHVPMSTTAVGPIYARLLRAKLNKGMSLAEAWEEMMFQIDETYVVTLLANGRLRVEWGYPLDWPSDSPWEGAY